MEQLKQHIEAIQKWQQENKENRATIVLVAEISNETENGYDQENCFGMSGNGKVLKSLLKDALKDKEISKLVRNAAAELTIESIIKKAGNNE